MTWTWLDIVITHVYISLFHALNDNWRSFRKWYFFDNYVCAATKKLWLNKTYNSHPITVRVLTQEIWSCTLTVYTDETKMNFIGKRDELWPFCQTASPISILLSQLGMHHTMSQFLILHFSVHDAIRICLKSCYPSLISSLSTYINERNMYFSCSIDNTCFIIWINIFHLPCQVPPPLPSGGVIICPSDPLFLFILLCFICNSIYN